MVKIRVLTENDWSLTFDLVHDLMTWSMISRFQKQHVDLISWLESFLRIKGLIVEIWMNWRKVNRYTKSQTLTFWSTLNFKDQNSSRHSRISNLVKKNQEIKKSRFHFEKSKFPRLRIFLSVENLLFFTTLCQI